MFKISKIKVFGWCLVIAIIVFIIAANDRQNKKEDKVSIDIEKTLEDMENRDVVNNRISELRKIRQEKELLEHREKLEQERLAEVKRVEQEKLAKIEADRVAKAKKDKEAKQGQVVASNDTKTVSRGNGGNRGRLLGTFQASAYTDNAQSQGKYVGQTSTGMKPQVGVIAVDPTVIPYHTKLYIEGYGNAVAGDCGGAIKGNRIDLFMNTQKQCMNFGRKSVKVWIRD